MDNIRLVRILTFAAAGIAVVLFVLMTVGEGSVMHVWQLRKEIAVQKEVLEKLQARNEILEAQVRSLKENPEAVEGLARGDLGMIRQGESYFLVSDPEEEDAAPDAPVEAP